MNHPEYSFLDAARWMAPDKGAEDDTETFRDREWWAQYFVEIMKKIEDRKNPDGFMMLECELMDSSKFGRRWLLPFGGESTFKTVPNHPFSIDGTASGTVCVKGVYRKTE